MKYKAFISYRRSDCSELAQLVKLAIEEQGDDSAVSVPHVAL